MELILKETDPINRKYFIEDYVGSTIRGLTVLGKVPTTACALWRVQSSTGVITDITPRKLLAPTKSDPLKSVLHAMKARCYNQKHKSYKNYGARGITVCDEWVTSPKTFINWAEANGYRPGLQIDRRNNNGNYEPGNCRFITAQQNACNRRKKNNTTGYTGVRLNSSGSFSTEINNIRLGTFSTKEKALRVRNDYIIKNNLYNPIQELR